ncbi:NUDIX hydrolase [Candidatus Babeliales bacterium]|nr:NUDIX hydrolase [Candidatus Babeliales bacterium]
MKRDQLLALLERYNPTDTAEKEFKTRTIAFVKEHKDCFERTLLIGHITASAWLLNKEETKALLLHHTKLDRWFQLGGHCDGDSDVLAVAIKEAQEESGINGIKAVNPAIFDIDIHTIPARKDEPEHDHYDIRFLLKVTSDEDVVQNRESKELRWITKDPHTMPTQARSVSRMFEKWISL